MTLIARGFLKFPQPEPEVNNSPNHLQAHKLAAQHFSRTHFLGRHDVYPELSFNELCFLGQWGLYHSRKVFFFHIVLDFNTLGMTDQTLGNLNEDEEVNQYWLCIFIPLLGLFPRLDILRDLINHHQKSVLHLV